MKNARVLLATGFLMLAGCGGSSEASDNTLSDVELYEEAIADDESTNGDSQSEAAETTTRPEVTIPDEFNQPEDEILATYLAYHEARLVAWGEPEANPDYAPLYDFLVEPQATLTREGIEKIRSKGHIIVDPPNSELSHSVRFVGAFNPEKTEGNTVTLIDCFVDATEVRTLDGEVVESDPVTFVLAIEMKVVGDAWKVAAKEVKEEYEGVSECEEYANL